VKELGVRREELGGGTAIAAGWSGKKIREKKTPPS
jgi:hypothetical protein